MEDEIREQTKSLGDAFKHALMLELAFSKPLSSRLTSSGAFRFTKPYQPWHYIIKAGSVWNPFNKEVARITGAWSYLRIDTSDSNVLNAIESMQNRIHQYTDWPVDAVFWENDDVAKAYRDITGVR